MDASSPAISVIIPTLNEAAALPATLHALAEAATGGSAHETIIADGGSTDETLTFARAADCRVVLSPRAQRAAQMNLGAAQATGEILLFLHADTLLPPGALESVAAACADAVGGGFARRYASPSRWLRLTCWLAEWRTRLFGWHLGDQAIFVRREIFTQLSGFREWDIFEDVDFSRRLARFGHVVTLRPSVISSARRFQARGPLRTTLADLWLTLRYLAGKTPPRVGERSEDAYNRATTSPRKSQTLAGASKGKR